MADDKPNSDSGYTDILIGRAIQGAIQDSWQKALEQQMQPLLIDRSIPILPLSRHRKFWLRIRGFWYEHYPRIHFGPCEGED